MKQPDVKSRPGLYQLVWPDYNVGMQFSRLHDSHGAVTADLEVRSMVPGIESNLHYSRLTLTSAPAQEKIAKRLDEQMNTINWNIAMNQACMIVMQLHRKGEPAKPLTTDQAIRPPKYLVWPVLPENHPSIIFGDGGTGKSRFALVLALCLLTGWDDNPFGLKLAPGQRPVLLLDWETDEDTALWELQRLQNGLSRPHCQMHYRRCSFRFIDDLPQIQELLNNIEPALVIIDSIGPAVTGDLNLTEGALALMTALRQLNVTTLSIAHTSKTEGQNKTVFGSRFFQNLARSVWEVKKHQEVGDDELSMGVFCRKANLSQIFKPLGFRFNFFDDDGVVVSREQVKDLPELSKELPLRDQIAGILNRGPMTVQDIAEELEKSPESVRTQFSRHKDMFTRVGDRWGLTHHERK